MEHKLKNTVITFFLFGLFLSAASEDRTVKGPVFPGLSSVRGPRVLSNGVAIPGDFPDIQTEVHGETAPGRIFLSSTFFSGSPGNYIMICENDGTPYFYRRYMRYPGTNKGTADFRVQSNGMLSFHHYDQGESGFMVVLDKNFVEIDTFRAVGNFRTDNHEFILLPNGHGLLIAEEDRLMDMSRIVSGGNSNANVIGNHIQEVDSEGNLYWEWNCWDHLDVTDADPGLVNLRGGSIDYIHLNSIAIDYDGNYVLSLRHFSQFVKIDRNTGAIIWRVGGANNEFEFLNDAQRFSSQHHVTPVPGFPDHYTVYDNGNGHTPSNTRAVEYALDTEAMTAEKVWEYDYTGVGFQNMMGSVQRLDNGNTYIDWSAWPPTRACEVDADNNLLFELTSAGVSGYRSFRFEWEGHMLKPDLIVESGAEGVTCIINQFGADDIDYYRIYHGTEPDPSTLLDTTRLNLKTFDQLENNQMHYFRVTSVNQSGEESDFSNEGAAFVKRIALGDNQILNGSFSDSNEYWEFNIYGFMEASGSVVNDEYRLSVTAATFGAAYFYQYPVILTHDEEYRLEFDARSDRTLQLYPFVQAANSNADYSRIGAIQVKPETAHYAYDFKMNALSTADAVVVFILDSEGDVFIDNVVFKQISGVSVSENPPRSLRTYQLDRNYPNPFNGETNIHFYLPAAGEVKFVLFDILGQEIRSFASGRYAAGDHQIRFSDNTLNTGVYFYRMEARSAAGRTIQTKIQKMIYMK